MIDPQTEVLKLRECLAEMQSEVARGKQAEQPLRSFTESLAVSVGEESIGCARRRPDSCVVLLAAQSEGVVGPSSRPLDSLSLSSRAPCSWRRAEAQPQKVQVISNQDISSIPYMNLTSGSFYI